MRAELGLVGKWELEKAERWNLKEPGGWCWRGWEVEDGGAGKWELERAGR